MATAKIIKNDAFLRNGWYAILVVSAIFMKTHDLLTQLNDIYTCLKKGDELEAARVFVSLHITDTPMHFSLPTNTRLLIWNLHEYLVIGDHEHATDKQEIFKRFEILNEEFTA